MFGYRLIKDKEVENLKSELVAAKETIATQSNQIDELMLKVGELESIISKFNKTTNVKSENKEDKPVKKVRRKSTKKNTKKEE